MKNFTPAELEMFTKMTFDLVYYILESYPGDTKEAITDFISVLNKMGVPESVIDEAWIRIAAKNS